MCLVKVETGTMSTSILLLCDVPEKGTTLKVASYLVSLSSESFQSFSISSFTTYQADKVESLHCGGLG